MTQDYLRELFEYNDGQLIWKKVLSNRVRIGQPAGSLQKTGYIATNIKGKKYYNHRLVYIYHNGSIEENAFIDHIDRNKTNNSIQNLRCVTKQENTFNTDPKGFIKHKGTYVARITLNHKQYNIGTYKTAEEATKAYNSIKPALHVYLQTHPTEDAIRAKILEVRPKVQLNNTSGYKGVHKRPNGTYQARIRENGKVVSLGHYKTAEEAYKQIIKIKNNHP